MNSSMEFEDISLGGSGASTIAVVGLAGELFSEHDILSMLRDG